MNATELVSAKRLRSLALEVTVYYILLSGLSIILVDEALRTLVSDPILQNRLRNYADSLTVVITGIVIYAILNHQVRQIRRSSDQLRTNEQVFRMIVMSIKDHALLMLDPDGNIKTWNEGASQLLLYSAGEAIGRNQREIFGDQTDPEILERARISGAAHAQQWLRRKDGTSFAAEVNYAPILDQDVQLQGFSVLIRDLTEPHRAYEQVQQLFHVLDSANEGIIIQDLTGIIRYFNKGCERIVGWTQGEVLGQNVSLLYRNPEDFQRITQALVERGHFRSEIMVKAKNGDERVVLTQVSVVPDHPNLVFCLFNDLTEQKQMQKQFLRAQRLETIGTLSAGIAHDLNNVMTPIVMAAQMLDPRKSEAELARLKEVIVHSCNRATSIVRQLLSFSRGAKEDVIVMQSRHLLKAIINLVREAFPKTVHVEDCIASDLWPIRGNPTQFDQVIMNLCVNARDAMPNGGTISITAENVILDETFCQSCPEARPGEFMKICVSDTGTGIAPEILQKIWSPFFTTKEEGKGTGLGLTTVRRLVEEEHQGFIRLFSEVGKGTRFELYLPSAEQNLQVPGITYHRGNGEGVLIIEPETPARQALEMMLEHLGYFPIPARHTPEAIERVDAQRRKPAAIILDPGAGDALTSMLGRYPHVPIITHTAVEPGRLGTPDASFITKHSIQLPKPATEVQVACALYRALLKGTEAKQPDQAA